MLEYNVLDGRDVMWTFNKIIFIIKYLFHAIVRDPIGCNKIDKILFHTILSISAPSQIYALYVVSMEAAFKKPHALLKS